MGIICSSVPEIDDLYFDQMPNSRPVAIEKAVRVGKAYIMKGKNGKLYSNSIGSYAYIPGKWPWLEDVMKALLKLDVITKDQMAAHLEHCYRNDLSRKKKYALDNMKRIEKEFGVKFTADQLSAVSS